MGVVARRAAARRDASRCREARGSGSTRPRSANGALRDEHAAKGRHESLPAPDRLAGDLRAAAVLARAPARHLPTIKLEYPLAQGRIRHGWGAALRLLRCLFGGCTLTNPRWL